ncbi:PTS sugar transporter subunit IIA [Mitsuokella multacida]|jgi:PTS system ascorbate-specific IIA component|uniref:Ascorbate-specific PTS system EIIA component n=2 Tax=Mitsuokella multacida TaxID=52226 RepID=C9KLV2_9FIRM|nr:PTS sugar transporter subunit IIA [Mitsuokella multacida]EEX69116.1 phosphoenolpyruvate-dependent sugar phosphotransferase system, EIIA 2 [Mitsuokella multacida DSM 20544]MCF2584259.1 PTS sugar transporter subunit IIA [Mitsuokella multacida]
MMELFSEQYVQYIDQEHVSWQNMIQMAGQPLLDDGLIAQEYVDEIITTCTEKGPYMNIGPNIVLAHARPLPSTKKAVMALLLSKQPAALLDDPAHTARLWIFLATPDDRSHIELIQKLATLLMDADRVQRVLAANSQEELLGSLRAE